jgi:hypothetical protein
MDPEEEKEGGYGVFMEGFKGRGSYWRGSNRRPLPLTEREGEIRGEDGADRWGPPSSEGERGRRGAGLARVVAGLVLPGSAQWLALFFFLCSKTFFYFLFLVLFDLFV